MGGGVGETSKPSSQFCGKPNTVLTKSLKNLKFRVDVFGKTFVSLSYMYIYDMHVCVFVGL